MKNKNRIIELFKANHTAYEIHLQTGLSIKEVYHYIRESEELKIRHEKALYENQRQTEFEYV